MPPKRIQRQRTKGWRLPPNTVVVSRPTKWGNPFRVGDVMREIFDPSRTIRMTRSEAVFFFRGHVERRLAADPTWLDKVRGRDLACWCPLVDKDGNKVPCHADVLLELANAGEE